MFGLKPTQLVPLPFSVPHKRGAAANHLLKPEVLVPPHNTPARALGVPIKFAILCIDDTKR
jgi:hypothetical protein